MRAVSKKRAAENRLRRQTIKAHYGDNPTCHYPHCNRFADDAHELLSRARGGSITDPANVVPLCRSHHDHVTQHPVEAEALGLSLSQFGRSA